MNVHRISTFTVETKSLLCNVNNILQISEPINHAYLSEHDPKKWVQSPKIGRLWISQEISLYICLIVAGICVLYTLYIRLTVWKTKPNSSLDGHFYLLHRWIITVSIRTCGSWIDIVSLCGPNKIGRLYHRNQLDINQTFRFTKGTTYLTLTGELWGAW